MTGRPLVFITGASSGIGQALAWRYHQAGYNLALAARRTTEIESWAKSREMDPGRYQIYSADVAIPDSIVGAGMDCLVRQGDQAHQRHGQVDRSAVRPTAQSPQQQASRRPHSGAHAPASARKLAYLPPATSNRSQNSRAAPSPPRSARQIRQHRRTQRPAPRRNRTIAC